MDNGLNKRRECSCLIGLALGDVGDDAGVEVNRYLISCLNTVCSGFAFQNGKADVDGIAVENPCKGLCDHTAS